jgi:PAS domain S-box-containing protein
VSSENLKRLEELTEKLDAAQAELFFSEQRLRSSRAEMETLIENLEGFVIYRLDTNGHVTSWSRHAEAMMGYPDEEVLGQHLSLFYSPEDKEAGIADIELKEAAKRGRFELGGYRYRKDGSRFWAHVILIALYTAEGKISGYLKVLRPMDKI